MSGSGEMEQWVPLLEIFLKSPSPVGEASHWIQTHKGGLASGGLWRFVPHLLARNVVYHEEADDTTSNSSIGNCMWIQTLPSAMQSSILSFLSVERGRFHRKDLEGLARKLMASPDLDFWVMRTAENLLRAVAGHDGLPFCKVDKGPEMDEYNALPEWLEGYTKGSESLFPWLPIGAKDSQISANAVSESSKEQRVSETKETAAEKIESSKNAGLEGDLGSPKAMEAAGERLAGVEVIDDGASEIQHATSCISVEAAGSVVTSRDVEMLNQEEIESRAGLTPEDYGSAISLREALLSFDSTSSISSTAEKIRLLCTTAEPMAMLSVIKPWDAEDEVTLQMVDSLLKEQEGYTWSTQVLSSVILPKLLSLKEPPSRILVTAVLQAGRVHQRATVDALLFPLILYKEGLNVVVCEVLNRLVKDCLHADHTSAFCQKLLFEADQPRSVICLPCHQCEISNFLVWTEALFTFLQNVLQQQVPFGQETMDHLVLALDEIAEEFSRSLKFGNFLLCLVNKCGSLLRRHKVLLRRVVERTNTFMTKSILIKLAHL